MKKIINILVLVLFFWFIFDVLGMKIGKFYFVELVIKDEFIDIIWWVIFIICFIIFIVKDKVGKYVLLLFVFFWCVI